MDSVGATTNTSHVWMWRALFSVEFKSSWPRQGGAGVGPSVAAPGVTTRISALRASSRGVSRWAGSLAGVVVATVFVEWVWQLENKKARASRKSG